MMAEQFLQRSGEDGKIQGSVSSTPITPPPLPWAQLRVSVIEMCKWSLDGTISTSSEARLDTLWILHNALFP